MRAFLILIAFVASVSAMSAVAQESTETSPVNLLIDNPPDAVARPSRLSPLATDSSWRPRFEAAADELLPALQSRDPHQWQPLLGGRWQSVAERQRVETLLSEPNGPFAPLIVASGPISRRILGWSLPSVYTAEDRDALSARPEAEALLCWSAAALEDAQWPQTGAEADNAAGRPYACARITYSMREDAPVWRAFIDTAPTAAH